jgi:hypothetical protein
MALSIQRQLFTQKEILGGECGAGAQSEAKETHGIAQERQQHTYEWHEGTEMVCESCHCQGVPLRLGLLSMAIIPARQSNVQCCFAPRTVRVVCAPTRLRCRDPIIAEHNSPDLRSLDLLTYLSLPRAWGLLLILN